VYLASDDARSINGHTIVIDGGSLTRGYPALPTGLKETQRSTPDALRADGSRSPIVRLRSTARNSRVESATFEDLAAFDNRQDVIPKRLIRRRPRSPPSLVVTRGGEYCFLPGLRALRRLADLDTYDTDFRPWTMSTTWW
jgi:hypothetical protein